MNKVILMGRLTKDVEVRYSQGDKPIAVGRYTLAVDRKYKKNGESEADFINCTVFNKSAEFAEKYFKKGTKICICGRLQTRSYKDNENNTKWVTEVIVDEQSFAESKKSASENDMQDITEDDDLPF